MNCVMHILKSFPMSIKIVEENKDIFSACSSEILGDELNLSISFENNFSLFVYPLETKDLLPYSLNFSTQNEKLKLESSYAKLFSLPESHYILELFPLSISKNKFKGNKIEIEQEKIKKLNFLGDMAGRAKVEIFVPFEDSLSQKEEYYVYLNKEKHELQSDLVLLDFFESIYAKDFQYATKLLSSELSGKLSEAKIGAFFGNFTECRIVNYYLSPCVVLLYENDAKVFSANYLDNKIADVFEI